MQVVLVYFQSFYRNSLSKCVLQPKIAKNSLKASLFWGGVEVINANEYKKPVTSVRYDKQQPFPRYASQ